MTRISVVMAIKNEDTNAEKSIYSFLHQNFEDSELIIATGKNVKPPQINSNNIRVVEAQNSANTPALLNFGTQYATGEHITFLTPDSLLFFDSIEQRMNIFLSNEKINAVYGLHLDADENFEIKKNCTFESILKKLSLESKTAFSNTEISLFYRIFNAKVSGLMIKKELFKKENFNENLNEFYFQELIARIIEKKQNLYFIRNPLFISNLDEKYYNNIAKSLSQRMKESLKTLEIFFQNDRFSKYNRLKKSAYRSLFWQILSLISSYQPYNNRLKILMLINYFKFVRLTKARSDIHFTASLMYSLYKTSKTAKISFTKSTRQNFSNLL